MKIFITHENSWEQPNEVIVISMNEEKKLPPNVMLRLTNNGEKNLIQLTAICQAVLPHHCNLLEQQPFACDNLIIADGVIEDDSSTATSDVEIVRQLTRTYLNALAYTELIGGTRVTLPVLTTGLQPNPTKLVAQAAW